MNVMEAFDMLANSCKIRTEALKILQRNGMKAALKYLELNGSNLEGWERLRELKTRKDQL
jgi:hypothetical protein